MWSFSRSRPTRKRPKKLSTTPKLGWTSSGRSIRLKSWGQGIEQKPRRSRRHPICDAVDFRVRHLHGLSRGGVVPLFVHQLFGSDPSEVDRLGKLQRALPRRGFL